MKKYYCTKCKKNHHRGKVYREHLKFKKVETQPTYNENLTVDLDSLRPIAKRQLNRLLKKIDKTGNHEIYKKEIIKLINKEKKR